MAEVTYVKQLDKNVYLMDDDHQATGYLVIGEKKAAVIDTMNGSDDLLTIVRRYTNLPVVVINTHGHPDHVGGNVYFDEAWMSPADVALAERFAAEPDAVAWLEAHGFKFPPFHPLHEGDVIDLGGVELEIFDIPGHTPGGILVLDRTDGTLYTGDSINWHTWMQLDHCLSMTVFLENLKRLMPMWPRVKRIAHGHAQGFDGPELLQYHLDAVQEVVDGKNANDEPYHYFAGEVKAHPYKVEPMRIIYNPARPMDQ